MLSRSQTQFLRSLKIKKYRQEEGKFLIEGLRLIGEGLKSNFPIETIWMTENKHNTDTGEKIIFDARKLNIPIKSTSAKSLEQISDTQHHQGIIALADLPDFSSKEYGDCILALDRISDPGNMGTLLRTAEWFGVNSILLSEDCVDPFNPKVVRGGMGAHFWMDSITTVKLAETLLQLQFRGYTIIGGDVIGIPMSELILDKNQKWVLVVGNEAHGISESVQHSITQMVSILGKGNVESLNAAVAGGVILEKLSTI